MKKLVAMNSTKGKANEQVAREAWVAFVEYSARQFGLHRCKAYGEYIGR